jgi:hypothetical protein
MGLAWSQNDILCMEGDLEYSPRHGDLEAPRRGQPHPDVLVTDDFDSTQYLMFGHEGCPSGQMRRTALPYAEVY